MDHEIVTLAERPDLIDVFWDMETSWPEFMKHDPIGNSYYSCLEEYFLDCVLVALDASDRIVAKAFSAPFQLPEGELPDAGWDFALRSALLTRIWGETPNAITAVEIAVEPALQGTGFSGVMVAALRDNAGRLGFVRRPHPRRRPAVRHDRTGDVRRAERVGAPRHWHLSVRRRRPPCGPR